MTGNGKKAVIDKGSCKGCGLCVEACPVKALGLSDDVNVRGMKYVLLSDPGRCTGCGICAVMCPDSAIEVNG